MSPKRKHEPVRLCLGCNGRSEQRRMIRFTRADHRLVPDVRRRAPGRGGYVHPEPSCLDRFARRKPFLRSLRASIGREERARFVREIDTATS